MQYELYNNQINEKLRLFYPYDHIPEIQLIKSGRNNKVFKVVLPNQNYLAKFYFSSKKNNENRLNKEFSFLESLISIGINNVPKPIFRSDDVNLAFYEFIDGDTVQKNEIEKTQILNAANFFASINVFKNSDKFRNIGLASEAFIDLENYLLNLDKRIDYLRSNILKNSENSKAVTFINDLILKWRTRKKEIKQIKNIHLKPERNFLSPSDFGFHNCIRKKDGSLFFIDFEYAGWDDYAKFICDFFIQPDFEISDIFFEEFSYIALKNEGNKDFLVKRAFSLLPVFRAKWCCIILNEFLPEVIERRLFSDPDFDLESKQKSQLNKANKLLEKI